MTGFLLGLFVILVTGGLTTWAIQAIFEALERDEFESVIDDQTVLAELRDIERHRPHHIVRGDGEDPCPRP